jgi:putative endonuclease
VYIIQSLKNLRYYIGYSNDPNRRLDEHNRGKVVATKNKGPWEIKFCHKYDSGRQARRIEYKLKKFKRRDILERIIKDGYIKIK